MYAKNKIKAYQKENIKTQIAEADPYTIIKMLMAGGLERMAKGKGCIERKDLKGKAEHLAKASSIVLSLDKSLNVEVGGEVAQNMSALYQYINDLIMDASLNLKPEPLDEAMKLLLELKSAWDAIPQEEVQKGLALQKQQKG